MHNTQYVTFALLQEIDKAINSIDLTIKDKLSYAIETHVAPSVAKAFQKIQERFNEERNDLLVEHCYTDEKGIIQRDEKGSYQFTKQGQKEINKAVKELKNSSEAWPCEVRVHVVKQWSTLRKGDKAISDEVKTPLLGILFSPAIEEEVEEVVFEGAPLNALAVDKKGLVTSNGKH